MARCSPLFFHFKSKGSIAQGEGNEAAGDGAGNNNGQRTREAQAVVDWLATDPTKSNDTDVIILVTECLQEDPLMVFRDAGYTNLVGTDDYTYQFKGQFGSLDHVLASNSIRSSVTSASPWHISDEPVALTNGNYKYSPNPDNYYAADAFASSDHDPIVVGLVKPRTNSNSAAKSRTNSNSKTKSDSKPTPTPGPTPTPEPTPEPTPDPTPNPSTCDNGICTVQNSNGNLTIPESQLQSFTFETNGSTTTVTASTTASELLMSIDTNVVLKGDVLSKPTFTLTSNSKSHLRMANQGSSKAIINAEAPKNKIDFLDTVAKSSTINGDSGNEIVKIMDSSHLTGKSRFNLGANQDKVIVDGIINNLIIDNGDDNQKTSQISADQIIKKIKVNNFGEEDRLKHEELYSNKDIANDNALDELREVNYRQPR